MFQELEDHAMTQLQGLTDEALSTVDEVLKMKEKKLRVKINAFAPNIVIPEVRDLTRPKSALLVSTHINPRTVISISPIPLNLTPLTPINPLHMVWTEPVPGHYP